MKLNKTLTALAVSASFGLSGQAFAIGTAANLDISNEVTLQFYVGSVEQDQQTDVATFKVDNKIDLNLEQEGGQVEMSAVKDAVASTAKNFVKDNDEISLIGANAFISSITL